MPAQKKPADKPEETAEPDGIAVPQEAVIIALRQENEQLRYELMLANLALAKVNTSEE